MAIISINKGKVPKDYTVCVLDVNMDQGFNSSTGEINSDLTEFTNTSALSGFPPYYMIAELFVNRNEAVGDMRSDTSVINWNILIDTASINKYRFIRFVLDPMITYGYNGLLTKVNLFFRLSLTVDGSTYTYTHTVATDVRPGFNITVRKYAFLFDTKTKTLTDGGAATSIWSDI